MKVRDMFLLSDDPEVAAKQIKRTERYIFYKLFIFPLIIWGIGKILEKSMEREIEKNRAQLDPKKNPHLDRLWED